MGAKVPESPPLTIDAVRASGDLHCATLASLALPDCVAEKFHTFENSISEVHFSVGELACRTVFVVRHDLHNHHSLLSKRTVISKGSAVISIACVGNAVWEAVVYAL